MFSTLGFCIRPNYSAPCGPSTSMCSTLICMHTASYLRSERTFGPNTLQTTSRLCTRIYYTIWEGLPAAPLSGSVEAFGQEVVYILSWPSARIVSHSEWAFIWPILYAPGGTYTHIFSILHAGLQHACNQHSFRHWSIIPSMLLISFFVIDKMIVSYDKASGPSFRGFSAGLRSAFYLRYRQALFLHFLRSLRVLG